MTAELDYYAVLGVLPTAERAVIRAAYRALAILYHPDRNPDDPAKFNGRMSEINEAYTTLSDEHKRKQYDELRASVARSEGGFYWSEEEDASSGRDPLEDDWAIAVTYFRNLPDLEFRLQRISWKLAYTFKAYLLGEKKFRNAEEIAASLEMEFLKTYFGENRQILNFAKELIGDGHRAAARALNEAVRVLGHSAEPEVVITKIRRDYDVHYSNDVESAMKEHGITFSDGKYRYDKYEYVKLEDAISYAKKQDRGGRI